MKRCISFLLAVLLLLPLTACTTSQDSSVKFYYCTADIDYESDSGVIGAEARNTITNPADINGIMRIYLKGPESRDYSSPFPAGTTLQHVSVDDSTVDIILSNEFANLTGVELTLACACLTKTLSELTQAESIQISTESMMLNNQDSIIMDTDSFVLSD